MTFYTFGTNPLLSSAHVDTGEFIYHFHSDCFHYILVFLLKHIVENKAGPFLNLFYTFTYIDVQEAHLF